MKSWSRATTTSATTRQLRVVHSGALHPTLNMGLDEALLLHAEVPTTLRLYRWQPTGLSIGYFQSAASFDDVPGDHVLVRRLTGGGAIYHEDELTFALTTPADTLPGAVATSYEVIHEGIRRALAEVGVEVGIETPPPDTKAASRQPRATNRWCFADPVPEDLLTPGGAKIVGSAQRRVRRPRARVLHHGSLVLRRPSATPFCGAVADSLDPSRIEAALRAAIVQHLAAVLDLTPEDGELSTGELDHATALAASRYANPEFTLRR